MKKPVIKLILKTVKNILVNTLVTTALSVLIQFLVAYAMGYEQMVVVVVFQIFLANIAIHILFFLLDKVNMRFRVINYTVFMIASVGLLIGFGFWLGWFQSFEVWVIAVVGVAVLAIALLIDTLKVRSDVAEINRKVKELRAREEQENDE